MAKILYFSDYMLRKYKEEYKESLSLYQSIIEKEQNKQIMKEELKKQLITLGTVINILTKEKEELIANT